MAYGYNYGSYPAAGYYAPPMPDQLAQLRGGQMPQPAMGQTPPMAMNTQPITPIQQQAQPINNNMIWVQGEAGAKSFLVANGNTVPLWDSENQTVYIKTVDASGMPSMRVLDYTERSVATKKPVDAIQTQGISYVPLSDFKALEERTDALAKELEELKARKISTGKKNSVKEDETDG